MFKKLFTLLFNLLWCTVLLAQVTDADPNGGTGNIVVDTPGDILFTWDIEAITGETGNLGVEYAFGYLWVTSRGLVNPNGNSLWKIDVSSGTPVYVADYPQGTTSSWGWRDLCSDGTYLYASDDANVTQIDPATGTVVGSFPGPENPNRALAYDPATDYFWTISFSNPLYEFDRTGTIINTFTSPMSTYGAGWDEWSAGGPYLWLCADPNPATPNCIINQVDPVTGTLTGLNYLVSAGGTVGGMDVDVDLVPDKIVAVVLSQETPDAVYVVELGDYSGGGLTIPFIDDFESYTVGGQLACQDPVNWSTWSNLPCDPVEDAFISSNYAYSGTNSVVFVQNNDVLKLFDTQTSGKWDIGWMMYIPAGKAGYFNLMAEALVLWDIEVYFDVGGGGRVLTGDPEETFTWTEDTWQLVRLIVDLDTDAAEFWFDGSLIKSWAWTNGTSGTCPLVLDVADIFGATVNDEMYMDDFMFGQFPFVPVELTSFTANVNHNGQVELNWSTATETNNQLFEIERRTEAGQFATIGYVEGHGTTTEPQNYSYTDATVNTGIYYYRLKQLDFLGSYEYFGEIEVDVNGPLSFDLEQNYPNPFNPSTNIKYSVPETGDIRLAVYNLIGEEVAVLVDGFSEAGFFEVTFDASSLPSGAYFYKLQSGNSVVAKKMLLMK